MPIPPKKVEDNKQKVPKAVEPAVPKAVEPAEQHPKGHMMKKGTKNFSDVSESDFGTDANISSLIGRPFEIVGVEWRQRKNKQGKDVNVPIFDLKLDGEKYRVHSWSEVISTQAEAVQKSIDEGYSITCTIHEVRGEKGTYLSLADVEQ